MHQAPPTVLPPGLRHSEAACPRAERMRSGPFAPGLVLLTALLRASCGSQAPGPASVAKLKRLTQDTGRDAGLGGAAQERLRRKLQKWPREAGPMGCPPGTFLDKAKGNCTKCKDGTFQDATTLDEQCTRCTFCESKHNQKEVRSCAPSHDRTCGCLEGHFKVSPGRDFTCKRCSSCSKRQILQNCSEEADARCGECLPSFCTAGESCEECTTDPLPTSTTSASQVRLTITDSKNPASEFCGNSCKMAAGTCGSLILLAVALAVYHKRRRRAGGCPAGSTKPPRPPSLHRAPGSSGSPEPAREAAVLTGLGPPLPCGLLQQGRKLYTVIDAVPVRRWKEFVRGLGLRDGEIELVELEHSQFREQQYEMLKRWCQQQGASLGAIFAILEDMQLGGCAQELREQLRPHSPPGAGRAPPGSD